MPLIGRDSECEAIGALLMRAAANTTPGSRGGCLVVHGEAGIGKSSLLAAARSMADESHGMRILTTVGSESEASLPYAGIHHLLIPLMDGVDAIGAPQRRAVETAFGMRDGNTPQMFLVALATLGLLGEAAAETPLLVTVDDAQWLDALSASALSFVARRLDADPIVILVAVRDGHHTTLTRSGLPELHLEGLGDHDATALLAVTSPSLPRPLQRRVIAEAEGNPLALVELPRALSGPAHEGLVGQTGGLPMTQRLETAFAARARTVPDDTRTLLLVLAADESVTLTEVLAGGGALLGRPVGYEQLVPAVDAALIATDGNQVQFAHPLIRTAVYRMAGIAAQRGAHAALAAVVAHDEDRAVWHLAASLQGPDEDTAMRLEEAAKRALHRGGAATAVRGLEQAVALTADPAVRGRRLLEAARLAMDLGRRDSAIRFLDEAAPLALDAPDRAALRGLRILFVEDAALDGSSTHSLIEAAHDCLNSRSDDLAFTFLRAASLRCWWGARDDTAVQHLVDGVTQFARAGTDPRWLSVMALADPIGHAGDVIPHLDAAAEAVADQPAGLRLVGQAAVVVGDMTRAATILSATVVGLRSEGLLGLLAPALALEAGARIETGDWRTAWSLAGEAERLSEEVDQPMWVASARISLSLLAGLRGQPAESERLAAMAEAFASPIGERAHLSAIQKARGVNAIAAGNHVEAFEHLWRVFDQDDPAFHFMERWWAVSYLCEAAVGGGQVAEARRIVADLEPTAAGTPAPAIAAGMAYAQAVLAEDDASDERFHTALATVGDSAAPMRARLLLAHGLWLRRHRRTAASRAPLRAAAHSLEALGAGPWAARARHELRASGETIRGSGPVQWDRLTPQELQIATLAAQGLTNREIGQQLYLSHRTVGSHLYRIFPKLGITSRAKLATVLADVAIHTGGI